MPLQNTPVAMSAHAVMPPAKHYPTVLIDSKRLANPP